MATNSNENRLYQVDMTGTGLIIHKFDGNANVAPKPGEDALTWEEAQAILLAGVTEKPAPQTKAHSPEIPIYDRVV